VIVLILRRILTLFFLEERYHFSLINKNVLVDAGLSLDISCEVSTCFVGLTSGKGTK
jgi:hypothetical protein